MENTEMKSPAESSMRADQVAQILKRTKELTPEGTGSDDGIKKVLFGLDSTTVLVITPDANKPPTDKTKNKTIVIVEERQNDPKQPSNANESTVKYTSLIIDRDGSNPEKNQIIEKTVHYDLPDTLSLESPTSTAINMNAARLERVSANIDPTTSIAPTAHPANEEQANTMIALLNSLEPVESLPIPVAELHRPVPPQREKPWSKLFAKFRHDN